MSKKSSSPTKTRRASQRPLTPRSLLSSVDPLQLYEILGRHFEDNGGPDGSAYQRFYKELLSTLLEADGQEAVNFFKLIDNVDAFSCVEDRIRNAGFVQGFECCRQLLLGELDLEGLREQATTKGAKT